MKKALSVAVWLCFMLVFLSLNSFAHKGKTDAYGGHNNRAMGTYHFHSGSLSGQEFSSKAEAISALSNSKTNNRDSESISNNNELALVGSVNSNKYHYPNCTWAQRINSSNRITFSSPRDAKSKGYVPCKVCKPPMD